MREFVISEAKTETAVLVGLITPQQDEDRTNEYLDELEFLAETAGAVTVKRFTQRCEGPNMSTYLGKGKLEEIRQYIEAEEEAERAVLRREYIDSVVGNLRQELEHTYVVDEKGNKRKLTKRGGIRS